MAALPNTVEQPQTFDEDAWNDLLNYIGEHRVIRVVEPELLRVRTDTGLRPRYGWLAEKLGARPAVDTSDVPQPVTLNDAACYYLGRHGRPRSSWAARCC